MCAVRVAHGACLESRLGREPNLDALPSESIAEQRATEARMAHTQVERLAARHAQRELATGIAGCASELAISRAQGRVGRQEPACADLEHDDQRAGDGRSVRPEHDARDLVLAIDRARRARGTRLERLARSCALVGRRAGLFGLCREQRGRAGGQWRALARMRGLPRPRLPPRERRERGHEQQRDEPP